MGNLVNDNLNPVTPRLGPQWVQRWVHEFAYTVRYCSSKLVDAKAKPWHDGIS
jgi:hypothetical protein